MTQETIEAINFWMSEYPESYHPCDMARFYDIFAVAYKNGDLNSLLSFDLDECVRRHKPSYDDERVYEFVKEWIEKMEICKDLLLYMTGKGI